MIKEAACVALLAGLCTVCEAQIMSRLVYEVSLDGTDWRPSITAAPGNTVQVRTRVQYVGTAQATGLAEILFQPVISNWSGPNTHGNVTGDNLVVQSQGTVTNAVGPIGGTRTTPIGSVNDAPGAYGRISPFGSAATTSTSYYRGFVGTGANSGLLRIAQASVTNWIGSGSTLGSVSFNNISGRGGINIGQLANQLRVSTDPAFNSQLDVVVFKFAYEIGNGSGARIMSITTPRAGLGHQSDRGIVGAVDSIWYTSLSTLDIVRGDVEVVGASVHVVPTVGVGSLLASGLLVFGVRRRRADRAL